MRIKTKILFDALKSLSQYSKPKIGFIGAGLVKIETEEKMKLSVSSIDMCGTREVEFNGECASFVSNHSQLLFSLGDSEETTILQESGAIIIKCGAKLSRLQTLSVDSFPTMPSPADFRLIGVPCADLAIGIRAVQGFQQASVIGSSLMNTQITGGAKSITCTATDGKSVAHFVALLIPAEFQALVPSEFCGPLADSLGAKDAQLALSERGAYVTFEGGSFFCKLSEGKFPSSSIFTDRDMKFLGFLETKPILEEIASRSCFAEPGAISRMELEFSAKGLFTRFSGKELENTFAGDFQPYKAKVGCEPLAKCLKAIGSSCKVYADEHCMKFTNGDLSIWSMNLRGNP